MKSYLQNQAKELDNELLLVDHPSGLTTSELAFCRMYAQGFKPFRAYQLIADDIEECKNLSDLQLKLRALAILKKPACKRYLLHLSQRLEDIGVASMLEMQMFLTDAIRTPIGMIEDDHPLCQKKTITVTTVRQKDGSEVETEKIILESISKMDAAKTLIKMKGWDAPVKVDVNHQGGVMVVPMSENMSDWEK